MNNELTKQKPSPLPKLEELYADIELAAKQNDLNRLLNCEPKKDWVRPHPLAKRKYIDQQGVEREGPALYIPISIIEYLLTSIFIKWRVETKNVQLIANSVVVEVRLHVLDPVSGEWDWQDGIGASPIHTEKGAGATEFNKINTYSVMTAAPAAEAYALKDAAEKLGKLFGKDLNRKDHLAYTTLDGKIDFTKVTATPDQHKELKALMVSANMDSETWEILGEKISGHLTVAEYQQIRNELMGMQKDSYSDLRNGGTMSATEINRAVKTAAEMPNT